MCFWSYLFHHFWVTVISINDNEQVSTVSFKFTEKIKEIDDHSWDRHSAILMYFVISR